MTRDKRPAQLGGWITILHSHISSLHGVIQERRAYIQQAHFKETQVCKTSN